MDTSPASPRYPGSIEKNNSPNILEISPRLISSIIKMYFFNCSCLVTVFDIVVFFALIALKMAKLYEYP